MFDITASIVTYHNTPEVLLNATKSFLNTSLKVKLYISDNSSNTKLRSVFEPYADVEYIFNNGNIGFGAGHNVVLNKSVNEAKYHLILNPDVYFDPGVLEQLKTYIDDHENVGLIAPKILYPDGSLQYSCRLLPQPYDFFLRRLPVFKHLIASRIKKQELQFTNYDITMNVPFLLGCFMLARSSALKEIGFFDDRYFMYLEDLDLCRRMHAKYTTIFYPEVTITHIYAKASQKNKKLLKIHLQSLIAYFNKWGWFSFNSTSKINNNALKELETQL